MAMGALVLLLVAVSHAQQSLDQVISQQLDTTTGLVVDASKKDKDASKKDKDDKKSVPEPSASVLLLIGLGVTGLGGYCVERRKRVA
jgi:hypothetical protein